MLKYIISVQATNVKSNTESLSRNVLTLKINALIHTERNGRQIDRLYEVREQSALKSNDVPLQYLVAAAHRSQSIAKLQSNPRLKLLVLLRRDRSFSWQQTPFTAYHTWHECTSNPTCAVNLTQWETSRNVMLTILHMGSSYGHDASQSVLAGTPS